MEMQRVVGDWKRNAEAHEPANLAFLRTLRDKTDKEVDRISRRLHREAFAIIDCTRCANCCKSMVPSFTGEEAQSVAGHLGMEDNEFVAKYLVPNEKQQRFRPKDQPCPFLDSEKRCAIYEVRPASCQDFPHTNRAGFASCSTFHAENSVTCPAVFYVIEQMRAKGVR